jgi:hypothetical protein
VGTQTIPLPQQIATGPAPVVNDVPWPSVTLVAGFTGLFVDADGLQWKELPNYQVPIANVAEAEFQGDMGQAERNNAADIAAYDAACLAFQDGTGPEPTPGNLAAYQKSVNANGDIIYSQITGPLAGPPCPPAPVVPKMALWGALVSKRIAGHPIYQAVVGSNLTAGDIVSGVAGVNGCPITGQWQCCSAGMSPNAGLMFLSA